MVVKFLTTQLPNRKSLFVEAMMWCPPSRGYQFRRWLTALLAVAILSVNTVPLLAQPALPPKVRITHVDVSRFPEVEVYVVGDHLPAEIETLTPTLVEDGAPVEVQGDGMEAVGVQLALVLDAGGNITKNGATGEPQYVEAGRAARRLVQQELLSADHDWLTTIAFNENREIAALRPWSQDHQAAADSLYTYQPVATGTTPLFDLLRFALKLFEDPVLPPGQERAIVIFSDGIDVTSTTDLSDALNLAAQLNIRVYPVMVGQEVAAQRQNLEKLSTITDGQYFHLASIENLDPLWQTLAKGGQQRRLTYRSQQAKPSNITVALTLPDGRTVENTSTIPGAQLRPVTVDAVLALEGDKILKYADAYDTPVEQIGPFELGIGARFQWEDGYPRRLRKVEYQVGELQQVHEGPTFDEPYLFPIQTLDNGTYTVRVRAFDELGMVGESAPLNFSIEVIRPPAPTPTPDETLVAEATNAVLLAATATQEAMLVLTREAEQAKALEASEAEVATVTEQVQTMTWATIAATAFGVIAFAYAFYILSNRERRRQATQVITGTVAAVTEPFRRSPRGAVSETGAKLVLVSDGGTAGMPPTIPIQRGGVRIGRDPSVVNVPLADRRVSKLHCRIVEDGPTGGFLLLDEGSTSGTYINDQEVGINGQLLQNNDLISIGPLLYRFEMAGGATRSDDDITQRPNLDPNTEPYIRPPAR
jgi:CBS domain-containing protein